MNISTIPAGKRRKNGFGAPNGVKIPIIHPQTLNITPVRRRRYGERKRGLTFLFSKM